MVDISQLTAEELDELIAKAAKRRYDMSPLVPDRPADEVQAVINPQWFASFHNNENSVLHFRHPGFGWVSFILPPHERANLLTFLLRQALVVPPPKPENDVPAPAPSATASGGTVH
jgi:hypothetical protein